MGNTETKDLLESVSAGYNDKDDDGFVDCCKCRKEILFSKSYSCRDGLCCHDCLIKYY